MGVSIWKLKGIGFVHHSMWMIMTYDPPPKLKAKCQLLILNFKTWYAFLQIGKHKFGCWYFLLHLWQKIYLES